ncbi:hypothetical protein D9M73_126360 [compost metagenome]
MELADRHDRRPPARAAIAVGGGDPGGGQSGLQHRQWRRLPLELDVGADRGLVRSRTRTVRRHGAAAGTANGGRCGGMAQHCGARWAGRTRFGAAGLALAYRCRSRAADRSRHRHVEEPANGVSGLSADRRRVLRPVPRVARGAVDSVRVGAGSAQANRYVPQLSGCDGGRRISNERTEILEIRTASPVGASARDRSPNIKLRFL